VGSNNAQPDLNEGLGRLEIKPETVRFVVCSTRDLIEDASLDVENWLFQKISEGMNALINEALIIGDGVGRPLGLLNPASGIPPIGQYSWQDLIMLAMEIPAQWQANASFLMNQRTAALLLTMYRTGRPMLGSIQGLHDGPRWSLLGFPIHIASQMPDVAPGATPIAFDDWKRAYTIVTRKNPTIQVDPYSAGFCLLYKAEARVGGAPTCPNGKIAPHPCVGCLGGARVRPTHGVLCP